MDENELDDDLENSNPQDESSGPLSQVASTQDQSDSPDDSQAAQSPLAAIASNAGSAFPSIANNAYREKLFDLLQHPNIDKSTKWLEFAAGMGAPTKTGSFSESMSKGLAGLAQGQSQEVALKNQYTTMLAKQYAGLAQQQMMADALGRLSANNGSSIGATGNGGNGAPGVAGSGAGVHSLIDPNAAWMMYLTDPTGKTVSGYIKSASELPDALKPIAIQYGTSSPQFQDALTKANLKANWINPVSYAGRSGPPAIIGPDGQLHVDPALEKASLEFSGKKTAAEQQASSPWKQFSVFDPQSKQMVSVPGDTMFKLQHPGQPVPEVPPEGYGASAPMPTAVPGGATAPMQNNNPGALMTKQHQLASYNSPEEGLAAIDHNLQNYAGKGINTLAGVISTWAPPNENNTAAYIKDAAQRLGIKPDQQIDLNNPYVRHAVGTALMLHENGPSSIFGAAQTQPPSQPAAGTANGSIPGGVATTAPIGYGEQYSATAKPSNESYAQRYSDLNAAPQLLSSLDQIIQLAPKAITGTGQDMMHNAAGMLAHLGVGNAQDLKTNTDLMEKMMARLPMYSRQSLGAGGTDAFQKLAQAAYPHAEMSAPAIQEAAKQVQSVIKMNMAGTIALQGAKDQNGVIDPNKYQNIETEFSTNADPRVWQYASLPSKQDRVAYLSSLGSPDEANKVISSYNYLNGKGWLQWQKKTP